jgi:hypothetical protein
MASDSFTQNCRRRPMVAVVACLLGLLGLAGVLLAYTHEEVSAAAAGSDMTSQSAPAAAARAWATPTPTPVPLPHYPPQSVTIEGDSNLAFGTLATFTARVSPITATIPYTYRWEAPERPEIVWYPSAMTFADYRAAWDTPGAKTITVTASNDMGSVVATRTVSIAPAVTAPVPPVPTGWTVPVFPYQVGRPDSISMQNMPANVTLPITYTWYLTDKPPIVHPRSVNTGDGVTVAWDTPGPKTVTVAASNIAGNVTQTMQLNIWSRLLLPMVANRQASRAAGGGLRAFPKSARGSKDEAKGCG